MAKDKCCSGTCPNPVTGKCPWRLFRVEDNERVYTGEKCNLPLCDDHGTVVSGKRLCAWHGMKAGEMGLS